MRLLINLSYTSRRYISQNFVRPRPRSYRRRLFEAAVAPVLPKEIEREWKKLNDQFNIYSVSPPPKEQQSEEEFTPYEMALVEKLRNWIYDERFRVMAVCHLNYVKDEAYWLGKNQFRLNGLECCDVPCKILRQLFARTPFSCLDRLLVDDCTCLLFGQNIDAIGAILSQCNRYSWIMPIVITFDDRILLMDQAKEVAGPDSLDRLRLQTDQLFSQLTRQLTATFDQIIGQIPSTMGAHLHSHPPPNHDDGQQQPAAS